MVITITPAPVVNAGVDDELCANNAVISLNGSVSIASGGTWSGGAGTFAPNANDLTLFIHQASQKLMQGYLL